MNGPSPHLSWAELACKDFERAPYPEKWRLSRAVGLAVAFERIRTAVNQPIIIGSAYRTPAWNAFNGGARHSQHMEGRALDLYPPTGWTIDRFYEVIREIAGRSESAIQGVGRYPTFVHIDTRPPRSDGTLTVWKGNRAWAEPKDGVIV